MKIAFDYQTFTLQAFGGISRYFTQLTRELKELHQQVRIFAPIHQNNYIMGLPAGTVSGCHLRRFPPKTTTPILHLNRWLATAPMRAWSPNILHETYYASKPVALKRCPTVITVYDMIHELFAQDVPTGDPTTRVKRAAIQRADLVICISENTKKDLMRLFDVAETKLRVVHLGFDRFDIIHEHGLTAEQRRPHLLYVGHRGGYKNFAGFLRAMSSSCALMRDFDVVAFGGPKFSFEEHHLLRSLGFGQEQVQHQSGGDATLAGLYATAAALVYPSLYEGFGIPPLEAMACECPVICSNASSLPEVVGAAGEYFSPLDTEDMRQAMERVVYSESRSLALRAEGLRRGEEFSWTKCAEQTLAIYRSLI